MTEPLRGAFRRPFTEQVAAFRLRLDRLVPTARWNDITRNQHDRAFMVAGAAKADLLADLAAAVEKAIAEGTGFEAFRRDFRGIVEKHGWHGWTGDEDEERRNWRMYTIYRTNMLTSYMAGRHAQLVEGNFRYWVYRHGGSSEPRLHHLTWDRLILPPNHPFWATHFPPNDWGCSCRVFGARSIESAKRRGGDPSVKLQDGWDRRDAKTGAPVGIGKAWDYAPGTSVIEDVNIIAKTARRVEAQLGASFGAELQRRINDAWQGWLNDTIAGKTHVPGLAGTLRHQEIVALARRGIAPETAEIMVRPGLIQAGDAITAEDWAALPSRLRDPVAVFLDEKTGNLVYILRGAGGRPPLAVQMDYFRKGAKHGGRTANMVVSSYYVALDTILGRVKGGRLTVLTGALAGM